jgi:16S rRNA processing protein RimM
VISAGNDLLEVELNSPTSTQDTLVSEPIPEGIHRKSKKKRKPKLLPTVLIPFVKEIVPVVDLEQKRIEITPPPGLIEEIV